MRRTAATERERRPRTGDDGGQDNEHRTGQEGEENRAGIATSHGRERNHGGSSMKRKGITVFVLAVLLGVIAISGPVAADPGQYEVNVTDGNGNVTSTYHYEADTGSINVSRESGWTNVSLSDPDHSALAIQWAVDNATATNHTIRVGPGTYNGTISILDDSRTIEAADGPSSTIITERSGQSTRGIYLNASEITVRDFAVTGFSDDGVYILGNSEDVTLTGTEIRDNGGVGLELDSPIGYHSNEFRNNTFARNSLRAIYVDRVHGNVFENNTITDSNTAGITLFSSFDNTLEGNQIHNNTDPGFVAIDLTSNADGNHVGNTTIRDNAGTGILVSGEHDDANSNTLVGNDVINSSGTGVLVYGNSTTLRTTNASENGKYGVHVAAGSDLALRNTTALNNDDNGLRIKDSTNVIVDVLNSESNGNDGIYLSGHSENVTIDRGTVAENTGQGLMIDSPLGYHDFTVRNMRFAGNSQQAIYVDRVHGNIFENNTVTDSNTAAIELFSSFDNTLEGNQIHNNTDTGFIGIDLTGNADGNYLGNNTVRDNAGTGLRVGGPSDDVENAEVVGTTVTNSSGSGIYVFANATTVRDSIFSDSGEVGVDIDGGDDPSLDNVTATHNSGPGIVVNQSAGATITASTATDNTDSGVRVNSTSSNVTIETLTTRSNTFGAILNSDASSITNSTFNQDTKRGLSIGANGTDVLNNSFNNPTQYGIYVSGATNTTIGDNDVLFYGTAGIYLYQDSNDNVIRDNAINNGTDNGIELNPGAASEPTNNTILRNEVQDNSGLGIDVEGPETTVQNNVIRRNDDHGIRVSGNNGSTLQKNTVTDNARSGVFVNDSRNTSISETISVGNDFGIEIRNASHDAQVAAVTLRNNSRQGIYVHNSSRVTFVDSRVTEHNETGVNMESAANATIRNNTILDNNELVGSYGGIEVDHSSDVSIDDNVVRRNANAGLLTFHADRLRITNNRITENCGGNFGISIDESHDVLVLNNNVSNNTGDGIQVFDVSTNFTIRDTRVNDNGGFGLQGEPGMAVENVTVSGNGDFGMWVNQDSTVRNATARNNTNEGLVLDHNATIIDSVASNNGQEEVSALAWAGQPTSGSNVAVGSVTYESFSAVDVDFNESSTLPSLPSDLEAIGSATDITNTSTNGYANVSVSYTDTDVDGVDESTVDLYDFNATSGSWENVTGTTLDQSGNSIAANLTSFSTFRMLGEASSSGGGGGSGGGGFFLPPPEPSSPSFSITSIDLDSNEVAVGEPVTVDVRVDNDGDADGEYTATLTADGQQVDSATAEINSNWHETFTLSTSFDSPGTYQLAVDGEGAGSVTVTGEAVIEISDVSLSATSVQPGETVTITATVNNDGDAADTVEIPLIIGGQQVDSTSVTLDAGESTTVSFEHAFDETGTVEIAGEEVGTVDVEDAAISGPRDDTDESANTDESGSGSGGVGPGLIVVALLGIVVVGGAGAYLVFPEKVQAIVDKLQTKLEELR